MKIGIIGDTHIGLRAKEVPKEFVEFFIKEKVDLIIHCGDINEEVALEELNKIAEVKVVKGNTDYLALPKELILDLNGYRFFIFHSHVINPRGDINKMLEYVRGVKNVNPNFIIFGHVHYPIFIWREGIFFVSPGTATGVRSGEIKKTIKSVAVIDLDNLEVKFKII
ncbi:MAG: YfcE family phosphodiesterase [Nanopusillaceae archaeon]